MRANVVASESRVGESRGRPANFAAPDDKAKAWSSPADPIGVKATVQRWMHILR